MKYLFILFLKNRQKIKNCQKTMRIAQNITKFDCFLPLTQLKF